MNIGELAFLFVVALLVFGPRKLPEIARMLGKMMAELRRASNEFRHSLEEEIRNLEYQEQLKAEQASRASLSAGEAPADVAQPSGPHEPSTPGEESAPVDFTGVTSPGATTDHPQPTADQTSGASGDAPVPRESVPSVDDGNHQSHGAYYGSYTASAAERGRGSSAAPAVQTEPWQTRERKW